MLDIKFIRENAEIVKMAATKKHIDVDIDRLIAVDDSRREVMSKLEEKRAAQNAASKEIGAAAPEEREAKIAALGTLKEDIQKLEEELTELRKSEMWKAGATVRTLRPENN